MIVPFRRPRLESWAVIRSRMLRETEAFLEDGLRDEAVRERIPAVPVGRGGFPRGFADLFWSQVLGSS